MDQQSNEPNGWSSGESNEASAVVALNPTTTAFGLGLSAKERIDVLLGSPGS